MDYRTQKIDDALEQFEFRLQDDEIIGDQKALAVAYTQLRIDLGVHPAYTEYQQWAYSLYQNQNEKQ